MPAIKTTTTTDDATASQQIRIVGARTHNLKNIDLAFPKNALVVITGRSGSGKSSLAIDTLFAEGQRQYIESLSLGSRQRFEQAAGLDVDRIEGLQPTICINQSRGVPNPRSTVGTLSEIYDYLRLLFSKVGQIRCHQCSAKISPKTMEQICDQVTSLPEKTKVMLLAPISVSEQQTPEQVLEMIRKERLIRVRLGTEIFDVDQIPRDLVDSFHSIDAVADRIVVKSGIDERLFESIEMANRIGAGKIIVCSKRADDDVWTDHCFATTRACGECGTDCGEVEPKRFSFNSPFGACETCKGLGCLESFDIDRVVPDRGKSLEQGAVVPWVTDSKKITKKQLLPLATVLESFGHSVSTKLDELNEDELRSFAIGLEIDGAKQLGLLQLLEQEYVTTLDEDRLDYLEQFRGQTICMACNGTRINAQANSVFIAGESIAGLTRLPIIQLVGFFEALHFEQPDHQLIADTIVSQILTRLRFLMEVGLDYLDLHRSADSLSGGELQRVRLAKSIGNGLTGTCYVLDEPTVGLHSSDSERLIGVMTELKMRGNTVVVVEHDDAVIEAADHLIEIGPGAGADGGDVVFEGTLSQLLASDAGSTGAYLSGKESISIASRRRPGTGDSIRIQGASGFNLKTVSAKVPLGQLCCVTGVSGSGKTTLIGRTLIPALKDHLLLTTDPAAPYENIDGLEHIERLVQVDQRPLTRSARGCAATFTGLLTDIRKVYAATKLARQSGLTASHFSFNSKSGRCPACLGHGLNRISMKFLADVFVQCEQCQGERFNAQTLSVRFRGFTIADVLNLSVDEARTEFHNFESMARKLLCLAEVGLGYLKLGQPSNTLSGGEAQRIKLAAELAKPTDKKTLYVLDEPTTGLQFKDVQLLLDVLNRLVESGRSVLVIEHHLDVIRNADWIIDLGPGGGEAGGEVVVQGPPDDVIDCDRSLTGKSLKRG